MIEDKILEENIIYIFTDNTDTHVTFADVKCLMFIHLYVFRIKMRRKKSLIKLEFTDNKINNHHTYLC